MRSTIQMDGSLLDVGADRFRATYAYKAVRADLGWALTRNPNTEQLKERERKLRERYLNAQGFLARDESMACLAVLVSVRRFIDDPESLRGKGIVAIRKAEAMETVKSLRWAINLLTDD